MKLLLHACCGPCSLEPVRLLAAEGHDMTIMFSNPNIQPRAEYDHRLDVLREWAEHEGIPVVEDAYDLGDWTSQVGALEEAGFPREQRCRACYHLRLDAAARYGAEHGFEALSTTLAVSPYQFSETCREELEAACARHGLACIWHDFRPYYAQATKRSRALGMYRQDYCGCLYSKAEAAQEKAERRQAKAAAAAQREAELAEQRTQRAAKQAKIAAEKRRRREIRDAFRG